MRSSDRRGGGSRPLHLVLLALLSALALTACGQAGSAPEYPSASGGGGGEIPSQDGDGVKPDVPGDGSDAGGGSLELVYTGSLQLVVADLRAAIERGAAVVDAAGGYVSASREQNDEWQTVAVITYRVPADRWGRTIAEIRAVAVTVVYEETTIDEVGSVLVDLRARIRNLEASELALVDLAKRSGSVEDLLMVQQQLTQVRGEIEVLKAELKRLEGLVAFGTLTVTYGLEEAAVSEAAERWDPAAEVDEATAALITLGQLVVSFGIWFGIVWLPVLVVLAVLALVVRAIVRRLAPGWRLRRRGGDAGGAPGA